MKKVKFSHNFIILFILILLSFQITFNVCKYTNKNNCFYKIYCCLSNTINFYIHTIRKINFPFVFY